MRYAINQALIHQELGWLPETKFENGIQRTIQCYLHNHDRWKKFSMSHIRAIMSSCMATVDERNAMRILVTGGNGQL